MRKHLFRTVFICFLVAILCATVILAMRYHGTAPEWLYWPVNVTSETIFFRNRIVSHGNQLQPYASVQMTVAGDRLYVYTPVTNLLEAGPFDGYLCVFDCGGLQKIKKFRDAVLDLWAGNAYYNKSDNVSNTNSMICYQIATDSETTVVTYAHRISKAESCRSGSAGAMYYPADNASLSYYRILGTEVVDIGNIEEVYVFDSKTYKYFKGTSNGEYVNTLVATDEDGNILRDYSESIGNGSKRIIQCYAGLVIHNAISPDMLYYIDGVTGEVIELFSTDGERTLSAVNVYNEYVFLSFLRYKDYDQLWFGRFEDDTLEGTWRINLTDFTTEKISDNVYDGLFIFDDTGIFACNSDKDIHKLDFDGNVIMTLLEH